jgi:hypothetical protein
MRLRAASTYPPQKLRLPQQLTDMAKQPPVDTLLNLLHFIQRSIDTRQKLEQ